MELQAIKYDEVLFSNYKHARVRAKDVIESQLGWVKNCKSIKDDAPLIAYAVDELGVTLSEMTTRLYHIKGITEPRRVYTAYKNSGKKGVMLSTLNMEDERRIEAFKEARSKALNNLKLEILKSHITVADKMSILEMYSNYMIDIFDLQEVFGYASLQITIDKLLSYETLMTTTWKGRYSSQFRTKMFIEMGEFLSDYFEGSVDTGCMIPVMEVEKEFKEYHFSKNIKNKVFARGLKMCVDAIGRDTRIIEITDSFTHKLLEEFTEQKLIKMKGLCLAPEGIDVSHYEIKLLPDARRLLSTCERRKLI